MFNSIALVARICFVWSPDYTAQQIVTFVLLPKKFYLFSIDFGMVNSVLLSEYSYDVRFLENGIKDFKMKATGLDQNN